MEFFVVENPGLVHIGDWTPSVAANYFIDQSQQQQYYSFNYLNQI